MTRYLFLLALLLVPTSAFSATRRPRTRSPITPTTSGNDPVRPSSANCTWYWFSQPLDHFSGLTVESAPSTYSERVCIYSGFVNSNNDNNNSVPILFYVGNESPVEEYVNNTGLMWTLGKSLGAHVVFAEHRYFGQSMPQLQGVHNCLAYCTSAQALADYATLVRHLKTNVLEGSSQGAVVAFGGSYGGMLAAWARMKYPTIFQGAIAASAPIWGFPLDGVRLDGSMVPVTRSASTEGGAKDACKNSLLAVWPLMRELGKTQKGRDLLFESFDLCPSSPLLSPEAVERLIQYGHGPWFELAEGDYPFPSDYITYAVASTASPLPAWPVREACRPIEIDVDVVVEGNASDVLFDVSVDGGKVVVHVDWNTSSITTKNGVSGLIESTSVQKLLRGVSDGISIWYNVTGDKTCYDLDGGDQSDSGSSSESGTTTNSTAESIAERRGDQFDGDIEVVVRGGEEDAGDAGDGVCTAATIPGGNAAGWGVLCCNENLNLVNTLVSGVGNDMFWPPSVASRLWNRTKQIIDSGNDEMSCYNEYASMGLFGVPKTSDPFATWENVYYGGLDGPQESSNIVFSNGLLDPWTAAGVTKNVSDSVISVLLDLGGHHLDLFFSTKDDPPCAINARKIEKMNVMKWIQEHNEKQSKYA